ncbi:MAG: hypothetical protein ACM3PE_05855 [Deltaproteobacteria bacterium]
MARSMVTTALIAIILGLTVYVAGMFYQNEPAFTANNLIVISDLSSLL